MTCFDEMNIKGQKWEVLETYCVISEDFSILSLWPFWGAI